MSPSPEKIPSNPVPIAAPVTRRQFTNPNPRGTYSVPDTPSDSIESPDDNATIGEQSGSAQPTMTMQPANAPSGAAQTKSTHPKPKTTTSIPAAAQTQTAEAADEESSWEAAGLFNNRTQSPGLEAALAEYDDPNDDNQGEDPNLYLSTGYDGVEYSGVEPTQTEGDYDSEPDVGVEVRQIVGDDVRYGDVEVEEEKVVEEEEEEDEIDYDYDVDEDDLVGMEE